MTLLQPGIEIVAAQDGSTGTLGVILTDGHGKLFILTASHILKDPLLNSDLQVAGRTIAKYIANKKNISIASNYDAIAAEIVYEKSIQVSNKIKGTNKTIREWGLELPGKPLFAVGAESNTTDCILERYLDIYAGSIRSVAKLSNNYCRPGDSGAVWCSGDGYAVSMHIQGSLPNRAAVSVRLKEILKKFQLSIHKYPSTLECAKLIVYL
jgi:hypothetical protein